MNNRKFTIDWLVKYQKDHNVAVLIHPSEKTRVFPDRQGLGVKITLFMSINIYQIMRIIYNNINTWKTQSVADYVK